MDPWKPYSMIESAIESKTDQLSSVCLGQTWTACQSDRGIGFAQTPGLAARTLPWPGTLTERPLPEIASWVRSWDLHGAAVGLAACNALINQDDNSLLKEAQPLAVPGDGNLAVFRHFRPRLEGKQVVVIGRYPKLDSVLEGLDVTVLERAPGPGDLPDSAAEYVLPKADWVFITATSLINKTFPRLAELSRQSVSVLMGPSMPWLSGWAMFDIDFLAGVQVFDPDMAFRVAAEGGGVRLFDGAVRYALANVSVSRLERLKGEIAQVVEARDRLKSEMHHWYEQRTGQRFPGREALECADLRLSGLDTAYKRLWDAQN